MNHLEELNLRMHSLAIFRGILDDEAMREFSGLLSNNGNNLVEKVDAYSCFVSRLFEKNENLTEYIWNLLSASQNIYILRHAQNESAGSLIEQCTINELKTLEEISRLTAREVKQAIGYEGFLPDWKNSEIDFAKNYVKTVQNISINGYGIFSGNRMFSIRNSEIVPVKYPDSIRLSNLKGYEREREAVIDNTKALLAGKPAANTLLYGDAGTGKSSTVKAIVNEYYEKGLRLIEIRKDQLLEIPAVMESLYQNPLKFILFIDDLSFAGSNEEIGVLKAILEGTVSARSSNAAIYATSNRRHLINEKFSDRDNDEIHTNETIQEQISLSDRFGLSVCFGKPSREEYLTIVRELVKQYGIRNVDDLEIRAERYAIERGGRSPRVARQFADSLISAED